MRQNPETARHTDTSGATREAKIRELILAIGQGWYHVPDDALAEAILKRAGVTAFLPAQHSPDAQ